MWRKPSPGSRSNQLPALPPIVSTPQHRHASPNKAHHSVEPFVSVAQGSEAKRVVLEGASIARVMQLEGRVDTLEQANRALLEELVQVQASMKASQLHHQEFVRSSHQEVDRLRTVVEAKRGFVEGLVGQVVHNKEAIGEGQSAVGALVRSSQEVERGVAEGRREMEERRQHLASQVGQLREEVHSLEQRVVVLQEGARHEHSQLGEGVWRVGSGLEEHRAAVEATSSGFRQQLKRLEIEKQAQVEGLVRVESAVGRLESADAQLRTQLDSKVFELGSEVSELRGLLGGMEKEKRRQEAWLRESFSRVQDQLSWLSERTSDSLQTLSRDLEEKGRDLDKDHAHQASQLASAVEESNRASEESSRRTRELLGAQVGGLEKALVLEREARQSYVAEVSSRLAARWEEAQERTTEEINSLKRSVEAEREHTGRCLSALRDSLALLERESQAGREHLSTVINAEVKMRREEVEGVQCQCVEVEEGCCEAVRVVREGLLALEQRMEADRREMRSLQQRLTVEWQEMGRRVIADVSSRISALHQHIADSAPPPREEPRAQEEEEEEEGSTRRWCEEVEGCVGVVRREVGEHSTQLHRLTTALQELQLKLVGQIQHETTQRFHAILDLRNDVANIHARMPVLVGSPHYHRHAQRGPQHSHSQEGPQRQIAGPLSDGEPRAETYQYPEEEEEEDEELLGSEEEEEGSESEGSGGEEYPQEVVVPEREQFETTPEPHSLHSSISESFLRRSRPPQSQTKASQRHRHAERPHPPVVEYYEEAETQGTFTSAAPTPASQRKVLVKPSECGNGSHRDSAELRQHWEQDGAGVEEGEGSEGSDYDTQLDSNRNRTEERGQRSDYEGTPSVSEGRGSPTDTAQPQEQT